MVHGNPPSIRTGAEQTRAVHIYLPFGDYSFKSIKFPVETVTCSGRLADCLNFKYPFSPFTGTRERVVHTIWWELRGLGFPAHFLPSGTIACIVTLIVQTQRLS